MPAPGDDVAAQIIEAGVSIYDDLTDLPQCVYGLETLEARLDELLLGFDLDYRIRTRAKVAKSRVAELLGYPVPRSFRKTSPRFVGQNLDVSVQMANNFQIWNQDVDPTRLYVLIRVDAGGTVTRVRVLTGEAIARFDTTGTLTSKYQAKRRPGRIGSILVSEADTAAFLKAFSPAANPSKVALARLSPTARPQPDLMLPIGVIADRLQRLVGVQFDDPGLVQERNRGGAFHRLACEALALGSYADGGQFPDILCQVLEVKFQLSPTIDLGLVSPDSATVARDVGHGLAHRDSRYAVAYGSEVGQKKVRIDAIVVTTGADFFAEFQRFEGLVQNRKLQIPLPIDLFEPK